MAKLSNGLFLIIFLIMLASCALADQQDYYTTSDGTSQITAGES